MNSGLMEDKFNVDQVARKFNLRRDLQNKLNFSKTLIIQMFYRLPLLQE
jgi:hypothetical protein